MTTYTIKREASYRHRTTADVRWLVLAGDKVVQDCERRKQALEWLDVYTLTQAEVWAKHPHLKP